MRRALCSSNVGPCMLTRASCGLLPTTLRPDGLDRDRRPTRHLDAGAILNPLREREPRTLLALLDLPDGSWITLEFAAGRQKRLLATPSPQSSCGILHAR